MSEITRSEPPLRAGVVGVGGISSMHVHGYRTANAALVAVCDVDVETAKRRAQAWDVPQVYADAQRMFDEASLDVVSICTPASTHHDLVIAAAQAGIHVLCEKPIALDLHEAEAMIDACDEAGVTLQIGHQLRSDGAVAQARKMLDEGVLGRVAFVRLRQAHDWGGASQVRPSFATRASGGGGTLLDNGCHMMDLVRYLGGDVDEVYARVATCRWPIELEDTSLVSLRFTNGALGTVENAWTATGWEEGFWIYGSEGSLEWTNRHGPPQLVHSFRHSPGTTWSETDVARYDFAGESTYDREIRAFLETVRGERPNVCTGRDGCEAVRIVLAAYDSASKNAPVTLGQEATTLTSAYEGIADPKRSRPT